MKRMQARGTAVFLVDEQPLMLAGLRICGEATSVREMWQRRCRCLRNS
jgi:hypothetical protein